MKHLKSALATIDVAATPQWGRALPRSERVCRRAATAALEAGRSKAGLAASRPVDLSILLATDAAVRKLNAVYRRQDKPTNVLSFPAFSPNVTDRGPVLLGDVVLAYGVTAREAKTERKTLAHHVTHLVVHGVLHLLGYDHMKDKDASAMERLETKILAGMGIADPYAPVRRKARKKVPRKAAKKKRKTARAKK